MMLMMVLFVSMFLLGVECSSHWVGVGIIGIRSSSVSSWVESMNSFSTTSFIRWFLFLFIITMNLAKGMWFSIFFVFSVESRVCLSNWSLQNMNFFGLTLLYWCWSCWFDIISGKLYEIVNIGHLFSIRCNFFNQVIIFGSCSKQANTLRSFSLGC